MCNPSSVETKQKQVTRVVARYGWCTPESQLLGRLKQEDCNSKASLGSLHSLKKNKLKKKMAGDVAQEGAGVHTPLLQKRNQTVSPLSPLLEDLWNTVPPRLWTAAKDSVCEGAEYSCFGNFCLMGLQRDTVAVAVGASECHCCTTLRLSASWARPCCCPQQNLLAECGHLQPVT